jgi:hypothetical protein
MHFLLSGEGMTDIGAGLAGADISEGTDFSTGPMTIIIAEIVERKLDYRILDGACGFVPKAHLAQRAAELKTAKKAMGLPGKKGAKETRYFFNNARILARIAKEKAAEINDEVVAVLFRDSDGTASAGRGEWESKWESMLDGFDEEKFSKGVPMLPKPKSEAWLICAFKKNPYQNCKALEERPGNDDSPNSLKAELSQLLGTDMNAESLSKRTAAQFEFERVDMPSFHLFRKRLEQVIG